MYRVCYNKWPCVWRRDESMESWRVVDYHSYSTCTSAVIFWCCSIDMATSWSVLWVGCIGNCCRILDNIKCVLCLSVFVLQYIVKLKQSRWKHFYHFMHFLLYRSTWRSTILSKEGCKCPSEKEGSRCATTGAAVYGGLKVPKWIK